MHLIWSYILMYIFFFHTDTESTQALSLLVCARGREHMNIVLKFRFVRWDAKHVWSFHAHAHDLNAMLVQWLITIPPPCLCISFEHKRYPYRITKALSGIFCGWIKLPIRVIHMHRCANACCWFFFAFLFCFSLYGAVAVVTKWHPNWTNLLIFAHANAMLLRSSRERTLHSAPQHLMHALFPWLSAQCEFTRNGFNDTRRSHSISHIALFFVLFVVVFYSLESFLVIFNGSRWTRMPFAV